MRIINLIGDINYNSARDVLKEIFAIEQEDAKNIKEGEDLEDLVVNIMSGGGDLTSSLAIHDALSNLKCKVITRAFGECASGAFTVLLAGDIRRASKHTEFLHHCMSYNGKMTIHQHKDYYDFNIKIHEDIEQIIIDKTNITKEMLLERKKEDWMMHYDEALDLGVIHGCIK